MRVVRLDDGSLAVGRTLAGRGAWLCRGSTECLGQARRRKAFDRAFREARAAGVEVRAYRCAVTPAGVALTDEIPVITSE